MRTETKEFRVMVTSWYDEYGVNRKDKYYVQRKTAILKRWKSVTHDECDMMDYYKNITYFDSAEEASDFIKNILCKHKPIQVWTNNIISEYKCE